MKLIILKKKIYLKIKLKYEKIIICGKLINIFHKKKIYKINRLLIFIIKYDTETIIINLVEYFLIKKNNYRFKNMYFNINKPLSEYFYIIDKFHIDYLNLTKKNY